MANATPIRAFLVSLGWDIDTAGMNRFATSIAVQTEAVRELGEGLKAAAMKVADFVRETAKGLDDLYFTSVKIKASVAHIEAFRYALEQLGINAEGPMAAVQTLANEIAYNPNISTWLKNNLGVDAKDATGKLRDTILVAREALDAVAKKPKINQPAYLDFLHVDPQAFEAITSPEYASAFDDFLARQKAAGVDAEEAARRFHNFQSAVRRLNSEIGILQERVLTALLQQWDQLSAKTKQQIKDFLDLGAQIGRLTYWWEHLDQQTKSQITSKITAVADSIVELGKQIGRLIYWWDHFDSETKSHIITAGKVALAFAGLFGGLVGVGSAIKVVTFAFSAFAPILEVAGGLIAALTSPVGLVIAALVALAIAFRKEIPWDQIGADWNAFTAKVKALAVVFTTNLKPVLSDIGELLKDIFTGDWGGVRKQAQAIGGDVTRAWQQGVAALNAPSPQTPGGTAALFRSLEQKYNLPAGLADSVYAAESSRGRDLYNAKSKAAGPFQFIPATAQEYGLDNPYDLQASADAFARKISHLLKYYQGDLAKAVAAYNWGEGNLDRQGLDHAPKETRDYIAKVLGGLEGNPYATEMPTRAARNASGQATSSTAPIINQSITTTVNGASDPQAVGKAIGGAIDKGNGLLVRSLQGRTS